MKAGAVQSLVPEYSELGHARIVVRPETLLGTVAYTLTLQMLNTPVSSCEDLGKGADNVASECTMTMTAAEIRSWGKVFAQLARLVATPAFKVDTEEWCVPARFADVGFV
jgi:hypothetical protein